MYNEKTKEEAYVRAGMMELDSHGTLFTNDSWRVEPVLTLPRDTSEVQISADGRVGAVVGNKMLVLGQIQLAMFGDATSLETENGVLFRPTKESGTGRMCNPGSDGAGTLHLGYREGSNVDVTTEMVRLMELALWMDVLEKAMVLVKYEGEEPSRFR